MSAPAQHSNLSQRGRHNAGFLNKKVSAILDVLRNLYDPDENPDGVVNLGIADNGLCRPELIKFFNSNRLKLKPAELTYADRFTTSSRLLAAIANLFNEYSPDFPEGKLSPKPVKKVQPEHLAIGSGATGILDELFWAILEPGQGVLISTPYYNAFDHDLTARAACEIVPVEVPQPDTKAGAAASLDPGRMFAKDTVALYEKALLDAQQKGTKVGALLLCNPHNPSGGIYPRETVVELARLAAKYKLHFVSDEIYARSCYKTKDVPQPHVFHSVLSIDMAAEAGLDPSYLHVVTSASKDFGINGFRLGVLVSQHNPDLHRAMTGVGMLSQSAAPAGVLWATWLEDRAFLSWYLEENRRRMSLVYNHVTAWLDHYRIPYVPANSGHFFLLDLRSHTAGETRHAEAELVSKMIAAKVFVAPGTQYHHPVPGFFRLTFTQDPHAIKTGLGRLERVFGFSDRFEESRPLLDLKKGGKPCPLDARDLTFTDEKHAQQLDLEARVEPKLQALMQSLKVFATYMVVMGLITAITSFLTEPHFVLLDALFPPSDRTVSALFIGLVLMLTRAVLLRLATRQPRTAPALEEIVLD